MSSDKNYGKLQWRFASAVAKQAMGIGYVFGGFVRDSVIHDHGAKAFFMKMKDAKDTDVNYNDPDCEPSTYDDRMLLPSDIDIVMDTRDVPEYIARLKACGYQVRSIFSRSFSKYAGDMMDSSMIHNKYAVRVKAHPLIAVEFAPSISIDVIHRSNFVFEEVFNPLYADFECNTLCINKDGNIMTSITRGMGPMDAFNKTQEIIKDCVARKAVSVSPTKLRIEKMIEKGYYIQGPVNSVFKPSADECCILCHDKIDEGGVCVKNNCCSGVYHLKCYVSTTKDAVTMYNNVSNCMMCRKALDEIECMQGQKGITKYITNSSEVGL